MSHIQSWLNTDSPRLVRHKAFEGDERMLKELQQQILLDLKYILASSSRKVVVDIIKDLEHLVGELEELEDLMQGIPFKRKLSGVVSDLHNHITHIRDLLPTISSRKYEIGRMEVVERLAIFSEKLYKALDKIQEDVFNGLRADKFIVDELKKSIYAEYIQIMHDAAQSDVVRLEESLLSFSRDLEKLSFAMSNYPNLHKDARKLALLIRATVRKYPEIISSATSRHQVVLLLHKRLDSYFNQLLKDVELSDVRLDRALRQMGL